MEHKMMIAELIKEMCAYESGEPRRINHFIKVHSYARVIGLLEGLPPEQQFILEVAAVVHDIGIKISLDKYNSDDGHYQQIEGPPIADDMLARLGFAKDVIERVHFLIAHHHIYTDIEWIDYQILVEADFLVNIYEGNVPFKPSIKEKIFRTNAGIYLFDQLYCDWNEDTKPGV